MRAKVKAPVDSRSEADIVLELNRRRPGYTPEWLPPIKSPGEALERIFARYLLAIIERLNQAPDKNFFAFLDLMGIDLVPAQAAAAPVVFQLADGSADSRISEGTRVAAPPPPDGTAQIVFETESTAGIAAAKLVELVSLWPGRDQYADHSSELTAGQPVELFKSLVDTPHAIYLAHDTLLSFAGSARIDVEFEMTQPSSEHLDIRWEYWDGKVWRGFKDMNPACGEELRKLDATAGLTKSGKFHLEADCAETKKTLVNGIEAFWIRGLLTEPMPPDPGKILPEVDSIRLSSVTIRPLEATINDSDTDTIEFGLLPDMAFSDSQKIDLTQSFYPFGFSPQPGATFYFANEEIFSKPGARVTIGIIKTQSPLDQSGITTSTDIEHKIAWDYWNGQRWITLFESSNSNSPKRDFTINETITFNVEPDMARVKINEVEAFWMRARLVSGGFGFWKKVTWNSASEFTYIIHKPPVLQDFRLGYIWEYGPFHAEHVLTHNDFRYDDQTYDAQWPGRTFQPFHPPADVTPTAYLGFDKKLPTDYMNLFFNMEERPDQTEGPEMIWEYYNGSAWRALLVADETGNLALPGMLSFIAPADAGPLDRFGKDRYWIRGRLKEDQPPDSRKILGLYPNAVWAQQVQTIIDEPLGRSTGQRGQVFVTRNKPVLAGEQIEVRELGGGMANVEWRILARELFKDNADVVNGLDAILNKPDSPLVLEYKHLRLVRNFDRKVTEVWVRWEERPHLFFSGPDDRHYMIDRARGRVMFGDGEQGKVPGVGSELLVRRYLTGGGSAGNVKTRDINQLLSGAAAVQTVFNPIPAEGGADVENIDRLRMRGPRALRYRQRALTASDFETMAFEANPAVAVARALPTRDAEGRTIQGWVTLVVIPNSTDSHPWPSAGLRRSVREYIAKRAPADLSLSGRIHVTGPRYEPVGVSSTISPINPAEAGTVENRVRQALQDFLHPLRGGPEGNGWEPGRDVNISDVAAVVERVEGVDYVESLSLLQDGLVQGDRVRIAPDRIAVAGRIFLKMKTLS